MAGVRDSVALVLWTLGAAAVVAVLARTLPPHGFYSGDQGVKLIAAKSAIDHPSRPFQVDLPRVGSHPVPFVDRFFRLHVDHTHALQSPLFPLLSAPLIAWVGVRGAYVIPAVALLAVLPLTYRISRATAVARPVNVVAISALLANPVFFYGLEFWEHVPAIATIAGSTAILLAGRRAPPPRDLRTAVAGALAAVAVLLRPEALWYAVALGALVTNVRAAAFYLLGLGMLLGPYAVANYIEGGTVVGYHAASNLAALSDQWLTARIHRLELWLLPADPMFVAGAIVIGVAWLTRLADATSRRPQVIALAGAALIAIGAALGQFGRDSLWHAWPIGALVLVPLQTYRGLAPLLWLAGVTTLSVWLTSTHDGGAQWGPRMLLISTPALVALASAAIRGALDPGGYRSIRLILATVIIACGVWTTRTAYRELRSTKQYYARLVDAVQRNTEPGSYILTNVWWLDQICADLYGTRTFLVVDSPAGGHDALRALAAGGVRTLNVAWSREDTEPGPLPLADSCYTIRRSVDIPERLVTVASATCED